MSGFRDLIHEIHRRSLWQVLGIYLVGSWIGYEVIQSLTEGLGLPSWFPPFAIVLFIVGLPIVLATAFVQEGIAPPQSALSDAEVEDPKPASGTDPVGDDEGVRRLFTWRNAIAGGVLAFALWGVIAAGWLVLVSTPTGDTDTFVGSGPSDPTMLVVLPFENLGPAEHEYFADGITEEITSRLAEISGLGVISRNSAMTYKDTRKPTREIGEELGVDYVLEGTVRWERQAEGDSRVRVTPQLIRVEDDIHVWTERYDAVLASVFEIQSDIAKRVAAALEVTLGDRERRTIERRPTENLQAYDYYLRGNAHMTRAFSERDLRTAVEMYERAITLDPGFALAYARLSWAHSRIYWFYYDRTSDRLALALATAERALELDPDLPAGHMAMGQYLYRRHDYDAALSEFRRARERQPEDPTLLVSLGALQRRRGEWEEALEIYRTASRFDPRAAETIHDPGITHYYLRQYPEAERFLERAIAIQPDWGHGHLDRAWLYVSWQGDTARSRRIVEQAWERIRPAPLVSSVDDLQPWWLLRVLYPEAGAPVFSRGFFGSDTMAYYIHAGETGLRAGDRADARAAFDTLRAVTSAWVAREPEEALPHSLLGVAYAGLGRGGDAVREGRTALELLPPGRDALWGRAILENLAWIHVAVGDHEEALERLQELLSIPGPLTPEWLRLDPHWDPIRDDPRFEALLAQHAHAE